MKKISHMILLSGLSILLQSMAGSCNKIDLPPFDQQIVVEGWIENGEPPIVQLTASVPPLTEKTSFDVLEDYIIKYARVYVTANGEEYQLYTTIDRDYAPNPVIYTNDNLKGKVGETYDLRIEYSGRTVTATTMIPELPVMENLTCELVEDGKYKIYADIVDDPDQRNWYKFFIRIQDPKKPVKTYHSAYLGIQNDALMDGNRKKFPVSNALGLEFRLFTPLFEEGDVVDVKLCSITEDIYNYWKDYNDIVSFSRNPFLSSSIKIRYNVKGGYGYWAGYGKVEGQIKMGNDLNLTK